MAQRPQALCPAHSYHTVLSVHKFWRAPLEKSATQLSLAEFSERCKLLRAPPPRPQPNPTLLLDAATQTFPHSAASAEASTQLPLAEFFLGCVYSNDTTDRPVPPPAHGNASSASLPHPVDIATIHSPSRTSDRHVCTTAPRARLHSAPPPPPGLEDQTHLRSSHGISVKAALVCLVCIHPPQLRPRCHM